MLGQPGFQADLTDAAVAFFQEVVAALQEAVDVLAGVIRTEGAELIALGTATDADGAVRIAAASDTFGAGLVLGGQVFKDGAEVIVLGIDLLAKVFPVVHVHHFLEALGGLRQDGGEVAEAAVESAAGDVIW